ncbi:MAG TPA: alpha/beta hydrolase [Aggregatilineales bacterium]|nr:alpha/beta hydrolase [Aggregatilineales bacterium]
MSNFDTERVLAGRVRMFVRDWPGAHDANPPVLFIHDLVANGLSALRLSTLLVHRRRVIAPDLRGRGRTDMPISDFGVSTHSRDLLACLETLGVDRFVAMGHGYGAFIALTLAAGNPERVAGLIMLDGGGAIDDHSLSVQECYYAELPFRYPSVEDYVAGLQNHPLYQPWTGELESFVRSTIQSQPNGTGMRLLSRPAFESDRRAAVEETLPGVHNLYSRVKCPVLILRAGKGITEEGDQMLSDDAIALMTASMPNTKVLTIAEATHITLLTVPSAARNTAILEFLGIEES